MCQFCSQLWKSPIEDWDYAEIECEWTVTVQLIVQKLISIWSLSISLVDWTSSTQVRSYFGVMGYPTSKNSANNISSIQEMLWLPVFSIVFLRWISTCLLPFYWILVLTRLIAEKLFGNKKNFFCSTNLIFKCCNWSSTTRNLFLSVQVIIWILLSMFLLSWRLFLLFLLWFRSIH